MANPTGMKLLPILYHYSTSIHWCLHTCRGSSVSTAGESNRVLSLVPSSPADGVRNFCSASFNVLANFSSDFEHVLSFTSCKNPHQTHNFHTLDTVMDTHETTTTISAIHSPSSRLHALAHVQLSIYHVKKWQSETTNIIPEHLWQAWKDGFFSYSQTIHTFHANTDERRTLSIRRQSVFKSFRTFSLLVDNRSEHSTLTRVRTLKLSGLERISLDSLTARSSCGVSSYHFTTDKTM